MARDESSGAKIIPKCIWWGRGLVPFWVLRHSFLSLTDCSWPYNIQLKPSRGALFLPPSDAYVRSFLSVLYTLIILYYTKALSDQASSLAPDWFFSSRGQESRRHDSTTTFQKDRCSKTPILWPRDGRSQLIGKDPDAGKDWRWEEKGTTEDEMVGWHHQHSRHEFE